MNNHLTDAGIVINVLCTKGPESKCPYFVGGKTYKAWKRRDQMQLEVWNVLCENGHERTIMLNTPCGHLVCGSSLRFGGQSDEKVMEMFGHWSNADFAMKPGRWNYEGDGDANNRTFYVWRYNDAEKDGIERKDFPTKQEALKFIMNETPSKMNTTSTVPTSAPKDAEFYLPFKEGDPRNDQGLCQMFYKWEYTTYPDGEVLKRLCYHSYAGLWQGSGIPHERQEKYVKDVLKPISREP